VKNSKGLSLVEVIVAALLMGGLILMIGSLFTGQQKFITQESRLNDQRNILNIVSGFLQKYMSGGDVRFFAFSGRNDGKHLLRFLVPQPGKCADLSDDCAASTSFLFMGYDKSTTPAFNGVCFLNEPTTGTATVRKLLVDPKSQNYGKIEITGTDIEITPPSNGVDVPTGKISLARNQTLALLSPPIATVWRVAHNSPGIQNVSGSEANNGNVTIDGHVVGDTCLRALRDSSLGRYDGARPLGSRYDLSGLKKIHIFPYVMANFSGTTNPTNAQLNQSVGAFPKRVFATQVHSVGPLNDEKLHVVRCNVESNNRLNCPSSSQIHADGFSAINYSLRFSLGMPNSDSEYFVPVRSNSSFSAEWCPAETCSTLPIANPANMLGFAMAGSHAETFNTLNPSTFSFLKMEFLSQIRFHLERSDSQLRETFSVSFQ
jgi:type II secretory pathway pseudopilin PulG